VRVLGHGANFGDPKVEFEASLSFSCWWLYHFLHQYPAISRSFGFKAGRAGVGEIRLFTRVLFGVSVLLLNTGLSVSIFRNNKSYCRPGQFSSDFINIQPILERFNRENGRYQPLQPRSGQRCPSSQRQRRRLRYSRLWRHALPRQQWFRRDSRRCAGP